MREQEIQKKVQDLSKEKIGWGLFMSSQRKAQEQQAIEEYKQKLEAELKLKLTEK